MAPGGQSMPVKDVKVFPYMVDQLSRFLTPLQMVSEVDLEDL